MPTSEFASATFGYFLESFEEMAPCDTSGDILAFVDPSSTGRRLLRVGAEKRAEDVGSGIGRVCKAGALEEVRGSAEFPLRNQ